MSDSQNLIDLKELFSIALSGDVNRLNVFLTETKFENIGIRIGNEPILNKVIKSSLSTINKINIINLLMLNPTYAEQLKGSQDEDGNTAIHVACKLMNIDLIKFLIDKGFTLFSSNSTSNQGPAIKYLASGKIEDCEPTKVEDIIDKPVAKFDKKRISELDKKIKDFYNNQLFEDGYIDNVSFIKDRTNTTGVRQDLNKRLMNYFKNIKSSIKEELKVSKKFKELQIQLLEKITRIMSNAEVNDEEKELEIIKLKNDLYEDVLRILKANDPDLLKSIDLKPTSHVYDSDGLYLAYTDGGIKKFLKPDNALTNNLDEALLKLSDKPTLNQHLSNERDKNIESLRTLKEKITTDLTMFNETINVGVKQACNSMANLKTSINNIYRIWVFNTFHNNITGSFNGLNIDDIFSRRKNTKYFLENGAGNNLDLIVRPKNNTKYQSDILNKFQVDELSYYNLKNITEDGKIVFNLNDSHKEKLFEFRSSKSAIYISNNQTLMENNLNFIKMNNVEDGNQNERFNLRRYFKVNEVVLKTKSLIRQSITNICNILRVNTQKFRKPISESLTRAKAELALEIQKYYEKSSEWWDVTSAILQKDRLFRDIVIKSNDYWNKVALVQHSSNLIENIFFKPLPDNINQIGPNIDLNNVNPINWDPQNAVIPPHFLNLITGNAGIGGVNPVQIQKNNQNISHKFKDNVNPFDYYKMGQGTGTNQIGITGHYGQITLILHDKTRIGNWIDIQNKIKTRSRKIIDKIYDDYKEVFSLETEQKVTRLILTRAIYLAAANTFAEYLFINNETANPLVNDYAQFNDIDQVAKARKIFSSIVVLLMEYPIEGSNVNDNAVPAQNFDFEYLTIERAGSNYTRKVFEHTFSHYNVFSMAYYMMYEYGRILGNNPNDNNIRKYLHSCSLYKNICLIGHRGAVGGNMPFSYGYKEGANNYNDNGLDIISRCYYTIHNLVIGNGNYDSYGNYIQYRFNLNAVLQNRENSILYQGVGPNDDLVNWSQVPSDIKPPGANGVAGAVGADINWLNSIWFDTPNSAPFWDLDAKINLINDVDRERLFIDNPQRQNLEITMSNNRRFKIPRLQNDLRFIDIDIIDINNNDYTKLLIEKPDPLLPLAIIGKRFNDQNHKTNETFDNGFVVIRDYTNFRSNIQNIAPAPAVGVFQIGAINTPIIDNYPNHMNDFDRSWSWVPPGAGPNNPTKTLNSSRTDFQREIPKPNILKPYRSTNYFQTQTGAQLYSDKLINSLLKNAVSSSEINKRDQILNSAKELLVKIWNGNEVIQQNTLTPITVGIDRVYNFPDIANAEITNEYVVHINPFLNEHNNKLPHPYNISQPNQRSPLSTKYNDIRLIQNASLGRPANEYYNGNDINLNNIVTDYKNSVKNYNGAPVDLKNKSDYAHEFVYGYRHYQELIIYLPEVLFGGSVPKQLENSENNDIEGDDISKIADFRTYINNYYNGNGNINFVNVLMQRFKAMYDNAIDDPNNNLNIGGNNQVNEVGYDNLLVIPDPADPANNIPITWDDLMLPPLPDNLFTSNLEKIKEAWSTFITIDRNSIRSNFNSVTVEQLTNALMGPITQIILDNFGVENNTINQISKFEIEFKDNSDLEIKIFDKDQIPFNVTQEDFSLGTYKNNRGLNLFNDEPGIIGNRGSFDLTLQANREYNYIFFPMKSNTFKNLNNEFPIGSVNDEFILLPLIALGENILSKNLIVNTLLAEFDSLFDGNKITIDQGKLTNFLDYFIKVIVRYYCTIDLFYDEIKTEFDNSLDKINDEFKERSAKTSLGKQNKLNLRILNFKNNIIDKTRLDNTLGAERSDIEVFTKNLISYVNNFTKELNKHVYLENIYQYWNSNNHSGINLNRTLNLIPDIELNSTKILLNENFFDKFNEDVISKVNFNGNNDLIEFNKIGINYENVAVGTGKFETVTYNTGIINKYYSKTRYRILEEILLYTAAKLNDITDPNSEFNKIFQEVEKSFGDKIGIISLEDKYKKSLILSIFGDMIDNYLISNVTKVIENQVRTEVNKIYDKNNSTPLEEFEFGQTKAKINYRALSFDTEFGLNLYDFDDIVDNLLLDSSTSDYHKMMSYGDSVVEFNKIEQDKFYPSDFLPIIINKSKCFKSYNYDKSSNIIEYIKGKEVPTYNIDVLFRAIQTGNINFINQMLKFDNYKASIYSQKDVSGKNIVDIQLISFMSLLEFFGKSEKLPNYINKINEAYSIYLKDTIKKIGSHKNVVMNYDKLILLNLYMYNLEFYQSFYNKQEVSTEINIAKDPFDKYLEEKLGVTTIENDIEKNSTYKYEFELLKDESTFYKNKKKYFENKIEENVEDMKKLQKISDNLQKIIDGNPNPNPIPIESDKTKIDNELRKLEEENIQFKADLLNLDNVAIEKTDLSPNLDTNLFNKVVVLSKIDNGQTLDTSQFLSYLSEINKDDNNINENPFFIHNFVCSKIYAILKDLKDNNFTATSINTNKVKLENFKKVYENIKTHVETKNGLSRDIIKNENLKKEFNRICFTIDMVVGNAFLKVLRRYVIKFLQTRYPTSEKDKDKKEDYAKFIVDSAEKMLQSIEKYIQPDIDVKNGDDVKYTPSKLTKSLILSHLNYKIGDNGDISIKDETELFRYVIDLFLGNPFEKISSKDPMIKHLEKILIPYFKDYYRICITTIGASINGYENYVMSIYKNLDILILLLNQFNVATKTANNMTKVVDIMTV